MELFRAVIEIFILAAAIYFVMRFLKNTRGSGVVRGLALFLGLLGIFAFFVVPGLQLDRIQFVLDGMGFTAVLALVVIFQQEIRTAIIRFGESPLFRFFTGSDEIKVIPRILRAVSRLRSDRTGAIIVIQREAPLTNIVKRGIKLDANVNSFLLESIFFPGNSLHDGAVIIKGDRILAAGCLLPLSENPEISKRLGTRHRAALGISERSDAIALVVSEETGKVSLAMSGRLSQDLKLSEVEEFLEDAYGVKEGRS